MSEPSPSSSGTAPGASAPAVYPSSEPATTVPSVDAVAPTETLATGTSAENASTTPSSSSSSSSSSDAAGVSSSSAAFDLPASPTATKDPLTLAPGMAAEGAGTSALAGGPAATATARADLKNALPETLKATSISLKRAEERGSSADLDAKALAGLLKMLASAPAPAPSRSATLEATARVLEVVSKTTSFPLNRSPSETQRVVMANKGQNLCYLNSLVQCFQHTHLRAGMLDAKQAHEAAPAHAHDPRTCVTCAGALLLQSFPEKETALPGDPSQVLSLDPSVLVDPRTAKPVNPAALYMTMLRDCTEVSAAGMARRVQEHFPSMKIGEMVDAEEAYVRLMELMHAETCGTKGLITVSSDSMEASMATGAALERAEAAALSAGVEADVSGSSLPTVSVDGKEHLVVPFSPHVPPNRVPSAAPDYSCCPAHALGAYELLTYRTCFACRGQSPGHLDTPFILRLEANKMTSAIELFGRRDPANPGHALIDLSILPEVVSFCTESAARESEKSHSPADPASKVSHSATCPAVETFKTQAMEKAVADGRIDGSDFSVAVKIAQEAVDKMPFNVQYASSHNPMVFGVSFNFPDVASMGATVRRAFAGNALVFFGEFVNWMSVFPPKPQRGTTTNRLSAARAAAQAAGAVAPAPCSTTARGGTSQVSSGSASTGGGAVGGAGAMPDDAAADDYFAWIADEHERGLSLSAPGNIRSQQSGVYRLRSLVCHVGLHYVSFMHSRSLEYGIHKELYEKSAGGMWKHYNDEMPMVPMPEFAAVKNACETGSFQHCAWSRQRLNMPVTQSCPCGFDLHNPLLPRVMLYEWQDPRPVIFSALEKLVSGVAPSGATSAASVIGGGAAAGAKDDASASTGTADCAMTGGGAASGACLPSGASTASLPPASAAPVTVEYLRAASHTLSVLRHLIAVPLRQALTRDAVAEGRAAAQIEEMENGMLERSIANMDPGAVKTKQLSNAELGAIILAGRRAAAVPPNAKPFTVSCELADIAVALKAGQREFVKLLLACGYEFQHDEATAAAMAALMKTLGRAHQAGVKYEDLHTDEDENLEVCLMAAGLPDPLTGMSSKAGSLHLAPDRCDVWLLSSAMRMLDDARAGVVERLVEAECASVLKRVRSAALPKQSAADALKMLSTLVNNRIAGPRDMVKLRNERVFKALSAFAAPEAIFVGLGFLQTDPADSTTWYLPDGAVDKPLLAKAVAVVQRTELQLQSL